MPTIGFSLYTNKDMDYLNNFVNKVDDELKSVDGISEISISGMPEKELEILISEDKLLAYNISMDEITQSILRKNINLTGGKIEVNNTQYLLRSNNKYNTDQEVGNIIVRANSNGSTVKLSDLADVSYSWS